MMNTGEIRPGALIEMPSAFQGREPSRLFVTEVRDGKVIFRGGKGTTCPTGGKSHWWKPYQVVKSQGKLIRHAPKVTK
jgi:hypothetical protein